MTQPPTSHHHTRNGAPTMLLAPYVTLTLLLTGIRDRAARLRRDDGALTLETAVIASALFLAAVAVVAVIVKAITSRTDQIQ